MLERSALAENALQALHDEDYDRPFNTQSLNHETMIFTGGRRGISLDGDWNFCVDLLDTGLRQKWFSMLPMPAEERTEPWDYDPYEGETVPVPSCWQMLKEKWYFFEGSTWYTRPLDMAGELAGKRRFLRVGAAQYDCKVFLNGAFLGNHYGGSTPFFCELTDHLQPGRNWLMLMVNNTRTLDRVPMRNTDWFNYGGVYREVELYETPETAIRDLFVHLVPDGAYSRIRAEVEIDGDASEAVLEIPELGISETIALDADGRGTVTVETRPELWSPETPKLYDVALTAGGDRVEDRIGFRQVERAGDEIRLNGKELFLRGISVHEDDRETGKVTSEADLRRRFEHARALNCNYLRLAHYPHHEMAARLADELGFLLWEEIPVYWAVAFDNPATYRDARNQLIELVKRDRNRASVVIWSVGNENPDTDARLAFMKGLAETAKQFDPTRLTSAACLVNHARNRIEDRLAEHIDVIGINEYYGWYEENFEDLVAIGRNSDPGKPVVISETGADGAIGEGAPARGLFSEAYMTEVYRRQIATLRDLSYVKGMSPWILYDFRVERRQNIFQRGYNKKGLIAADKTTVKEAFGVLAAYYAERREAEAAGEGGRMIEGGGKRRYEEVAEALKQELRAGNYRIGDRLKTERQISEEMAVSRSLVREAVIMLEIEGFVDVRKGSGIYVERLPSGESEEPRGDIGPFELLQARQVLESSIAAFAATMVTKSDILRMREALDLERKAIEAGSGDYSGDELFHHLIAEATQNSVLVDMIDELWRKREQSPMWARLHTRIFDRGYRGKWLEDHQAILTALQCRDPGAARQAMWRHLENVRLTLLELSDVDDPQFDGYLFDSGPATAAGT